MTQSKGGFVGGESRKARDRAQRGGGKLHAENKGNPKIEKAFELKGNRRGGTEQGGLLEREPFTVSGFKRGGIEGHIVNGYSKANLRKGFKKRGGVITREKTRSEKKAAGV